MSQRLVKKLDLLIVKAFVGPFIATFFITLFVLVLQFFWLYIDDVVGKGVDLLTVGRLIGYVSATLVPLALPLAVLLSSIMTLGNLGETFELIAIKSAGISLLRFLRPLLIVTIGICGIAFLFNNNILPIANLKMNTLKYDIIISKPAFDIKEGVFYDRIEGYVIKIGKKEKDDSTIRNVVIYEQNFQGVQDNIIVAEKGKMIVTPDKRSLEFILQNGCTYQEKGDRVSTNTEFVRMGFKEYKKVLDLSSFKLNKTDDSAFRNNFQMLTLPQLGKNIDSLQRVNDEFLKRAVTDLRINLRFLKYTDTTGWAETEKHPDAVSSFLDTSAHIRETPPVPVTVTSASPKTAVTNPSPGKAVVTNPPGHGGGPVKVADSTSKALTPKTPDSMAAKVAAIAAKTRDSVAKAALAKVPLRKPKTFAEMLPDSVRTVVLDRSINVVNSTKISLDQPAYLYDIQGKDLRQHKVAWHEKITLSVACLVMFLIGAPLGSIIRKGGIGLPLIFAVIFFVIFFLLNNFGKKFVSQDVLSPIVGTWMATYVLTPIGLFLIYKALHDSQLFNKEFYFRMIKNVRILYGKWKSRRQAHQ